MQHSHELNTPEITPNFMVSFCLWLVGLICFCLGQPYHKFLLEAADLGAGELIRVWTTWALGCASSIGMLIINYPKIKAAFNKTIAKITYKKRK